MQLYENKILKLNDLEVWREEKEQQSIQMENFFLLL